MTELQKFAPWLVLVVVTTAVVAAAIYLTPLKWITVIEPSIRDVDSREFYADLSAHPDRYLFVDVRSEVAYTNEHAQGSISMPLATLYDTRYGLPKSGKQIVLICNGGKASGVGYSYLEHYGFFNVSRIEGGIEKWKELGLPVETAQSSD